MPRISDDRRRTIRASCHKICGCCIAQRVSVKLSGYAKFSAVPYPFDDCWPFVRAIVDAFTLDRCLWASDWPYLRAPQRQDYGPLLELAEMLFPNPAEQRTLFCDTPRRLFGFGDSIAAMRA